jgi:site-specific DNA recombinase
VDETVSGAAIYTRMSYVLDADQTKVADQERRCRELAAARGVTAGPVYTDNNRSAWKRDRKRPGWDAMLAGIEAGRITTIITYHGDRIIRQPRDLETLIELAESKGVRILSVAGSRDLDSADDRFILRIEAAQACKASDDSSRRKKAQLDRWRREGRTSTGGRGGRPFGFATDGVTILPADRCIVATRALESEADVIRETARRILAGQTSLTSLARGLTARGRLTPAGNPWTHDSLRKMLARPRYAGLMPDGESRAAWQPVLEREDWERLRLVLDARGAANPSATSARRWLLPGIATCGIPECGGLMRSSRAGDNRPVYSCSRCGRLNRSAVHLDAYVSAAVVTWLNAGDAPAPELPARPDHAAEWEALGLQRAEVDALLDDYRASAGRTAKLMRQLDQIDARMAELRAAAGTSARSRLLSEYHGTTLPEFLALPLDVRRALVRATVTVTVLPASRRGPGFREQDVRVDPVIPAT